jgi:hypothetical protein
VAKKQHNLKEKKLKWHFSRNISVRKYCILKYILHKCEIIHDLFDSIYKVPNTIDFTTHRNVNPDLWWRQLQDLHQPANVEVVEVASKDELPTNPYILWLDFLARMPTDINYDNKISLLKKKSSLRKRLNQKKFFFICLLLQNILSIDTSSMTDFNYFNLIL